MTSAGLLSLPAELLDQIYDYLDWDDTKSLLPNKDDIRNISLACKRLRETVLSTLFRHVTLRLRFADDTLVEPGLYGLRRRRPNLSKHVRCVLIQPDYEPLPTPLTHQDFYGSQLQVKQQWALVEGRYHYPAENPPLTLLGDTSDPESFIALHSVFEGPRAAIETRAKKLLNEIGEELVDLGSSADMCWSAQAQADHRLGLYEHKRSRRDEALAAAQSGPATLACRASRRDIALREGRQSALARKQYIRLRPRIRRMHSRLDALAIAISCIPTTTTHLILNAHPGDLTYTREDYSFALSLMAAVMEVFGAQIEKVTKSGYAASSVGDPSKRLEQAHITPTVLAALSRLEVLRLGVPGTWNQRLGTGLTKWTDWQSAMTPVARLEVWGRRCWLKSLVEFLKAFPRISTLFLGDMVVVKSQRNWPGGYSYDSAMGFPIFLWTAVEIRRLLPQTHVKLRNIMVEENVERANDPEPQSQAPASGAVRFVRHQVLPLGAEISEERFERLSKDYAGFLPLWRAEEELSADAGAQTKRFGRLVDEAMASRFRL